MTRRRNQPTSISRVAARYAHLCRIPIVHAAREFGLCQQTVNAAWHLVYPDVPVLVSRRGAK